ncbi:MAG TPA: hypothetical protein VFV30_10575, partial [Novosphingobium sp.]|nr:hypothetical protein [Novosphingobium sp.]
MDILGTSGNDILDGTEGDDVFNGLGGAQDTFSGLGGSDTFLFSTPVSFSNVYDGGAGTDWFELRTSVFAAIGQDGNLGSAYIVNASLTTSVEGVRFTGTVGETQQLVIASFFGGNAAAVPSLIEGSAGRDLLAFGAFGGMGGAAELVVPTLSASNWTGPGAIYRDEGDAVLFYIGDANGYVLRANEVNAAAGIVQALVGGAGNDTLIGSAGADKLVSIVGGNDALYGNGGNDSLAAINQAPNGSAAITTLTFAGSTFDGGDGTDFLSIGGRVNFQGTLTSIEGINLLPQIAVANPSAPRREAAELTISSAQLASLPSNLQIDGTGNIAVTMVSGAAFNGSLYQMLAGSDVNFTITGTSGNETITGTTGDDVILPAGGVDTIHADAGNDEIVLTAPIGAGSILDGGIGYDTLVLRPQSTYPNATGGYSTQYNAYFPTQIQGLEAARFETNAGDT